MQTSGRCSTGLTVESPLWADGTVPVDPAASKETVAHHVLGKQKNHDCQDDYNSKPTIPNRGGLRPARPGLFESVVIPAECPLPKTANQFLLFKRDPFINC